MRLGDLAPLRPRGDDHADLRSDPAEPTPPDLARDQPVPTLGDIAGPRIKELAPAVEAPRLDADQSAVPVQQGPAAATLVRL